MKMKVGPCDIAWLSHSTSDEVCEPVVVPINQQAGRNRWSPSVAPGNSVAMVLLLCYPALWFEIVQKQVLI
jgi:hypothetical protein